MKKILWALIIVGSFNIAEAKEITKSVNVKYFFSKYGNENGSGNPNWYYYWSQIKASKGTHKYDPNTQYYGYYYPGDDHFYIGNIASEHNDETDHDGIDCFAETCIHENLHLTHWWNWGYTGLPDSDSDWIPDSVEDKNGNGIVDPGETDPHLEDTDGDNIPDEEELCYAEEHKWPKGSADSEDWSNPGQQSTKKLEILASADLEIIYPKQGAKIILPNVPVKGMVIPQTALIGKIKWETTVEGKKSTTETGSGQQGNINVNPFPKKNILHCFINYDYWESTQFIINS